MDLSIDIPAVNNVAYLEYIYTGFYNLYKRNELSNFSMNYDKKQYYKQLIHFTCNKIPVIKNTHNLNLIESGYYISEFSIYVNDKKVKVVVDTIDTPWDFDENSLNRCDIYFKMQCPINLEDGFYKLNESNIIPFKQYVINNLKKIRPLVGPRPLSRQMDFNKNNKIIRQYIMGRENDNRKIDILAYLGCASLETYNFPDTQHPNIKRVKTLVYLHSLNNKKIRIIFKPPKTSRHVAILPNEYKNLPTKRFVSDRVYRNLILNSNSTLNIAGLSGSIPFRFLDAFLSGMIILTDTPLVKWYVPLRDGCEITDLGKMGYEILDNETFSNCMQYIGSLVDDISTIRKERISYQCQFYDEFLTPEAIARYVIKESIGII